MWGGVCDGQVRGGREVDWCVLCWLKMFYTKDMYKIFYSSLNCVFLINWKHVWFDQNFVQQVLVLESVTNNFIVFIFTIKVISFGKHH